MDLLSNDLLSFFETMKYDDEEKSLFLLGYLMGSIGSAQYKTGSIKSKPILNKINFDGISKDKLLFLTNTVAKYLHQYKLLSQNEDIFSEMKTLMDSKIKDWSKSSQENVYYILSGYAYLNKQILKNFKNKKEGIINEWKKDNRE